jgi:Mycothiol maleylpyruvate isomerase N-terminal domain
LNGVDGPSVDAFVAASRFLVDVVGTVPKGAWESAGLGSWTVLELVGHANRAHTTLADYLLRPRPPEPPGSGYFSEEAIAARGREAVAALGDDPYGAVAAASERSIALVRERAADEALSGPAGTTTLAAYVPTRVAELTIHGLDIQRALELSVPDLAPVPVPAEALAESLRSVTGRLVRQGTGAVALLALSGRSPLPPGFSAY